MRTVRFTLTGFGPFGGVEANPTQALLEEGEEKEGRSSRGADPAPAPPPSRLLAALPPALAARVTRTAILPVSAAAATSWAASEAEAARAEAAGDSFLTVGLHLGVDAAAGGHASRGVFALEAAAYNAAAFRLPDADGVVWEGRAVDPGRPWGEARTTALPLERVVARLVAGGAAVRAGPSATPGSPPPPAVRVSTCPGRYLCNWLYFVSLGLSPSPAAAAAAAAAAAPGGGGEESSSRESPFPSRTALFVHVPPSGVVGLEDQAAFLAALMGAIVAEVEEGRGGGVLE